MLVPNGIISGRSVNSIGSKMCQESNGHKKSNPLIRHCQMKVCNVQ